MWTASILHVRCFPVKPLLSKIIHTSRPPLVLKTILPGFLLHALIKYFDFRVLSAYMCDHTRSDVDDFTCISMDMCNY